MTKTDATNFINNIIENFREELLKNVGKMPDDWEGAEIREYIQQKSVDAFNYGSFRSSKMKKEVKNETLVNNL